MTSPIETEALDEFYLRYYVGHKGKFGHEFMEFELSPSGKLRYANNSNYKQDSMIRKEVFVSPAVVEEVKRIIMESEITKEGKALLLACVTSYSRLLHALPPFVGEYNGMAFIP